MPRSLMLSRKCICRLDNRILQKATDLRYICRINADVSVCRYRRRLHTTCNAIWCQVATYHQILCLLAFHANNK